MVSVFATLTDLMAHFEQQTSLADQLGFPGRGCLVANTSTEVAPHDSAVAEAVEKNNHRLKTGFAKAKCWGLSRRIRRARRGYVGFHRGSVVDVPQRGEPRTDSQCCFHIRGTPTDEAQKTMTRSETSFPDLAFWIATGSKWSLPVSLCCGGGGVLAEWSIPIIRWREA